MTMFNKTSCSDLDLPSYSDQDFRTIMRILELTDKRSNGAVAKSSSTTSLCNKSFDERKLLLNDPSSEFNITERTLNKGSIFDRLTLIKCYETTLRNQGMLPVEDSRIYSLLLRVVDEAEREAKSDLAHTDKMQLLRKQVSKLQAFGIRSKTHISPITLQEATNLSMQEPTLTKLFDRQNSINNSTFQIVYGDKTIPRSRQSTVDCPEKRVLDSINNVQIEGGFHSNPNPSSFNTQRTQIINNTVGTGRIISFRGTVSSELASTLISPPMEAAITKPFVQLHQKFQSNNLEQELSSRHMTFSNDQNIPDNFYITNERRNKELREHREQTRFKSQTQMMKPTKLDEQRDKESDSSLYAKTTPNQSSLYMNTESNNLMQRTASYAITNKTATEYDHSAVKLPPRTPLQPVDDTDKIYATANQTMIRNQRNDEFISFRQTMSNNHSMKAVDELINEPPSNLSRRFKDTGISGRTKSNEFFLNAQNNFSQTRKRNPSNSRILNLTGILSNTSYTTSFHNQTSARTGYSSVPKSKTSFKLVLTVFCAWQAFVRKAKKNKQLKAKLLHGIVRAINFHEQHLMFKVFNAFPEAKLYDIKMKKNAIRIQKLNRQRLLKKYLSKLVCIYTEAKLIKSLSQIAHDHHIRTRQYFIYHAWLKSVKLQKKLERKITSKFKKSPKVMLTFIKFIAYNWINSSDLLEFYSFCHCKNKVKPSKKQKFIKIIKFAIKTRMQLLFKAWQTYLLPIKKFKANRCKLLKQKTISQFKKFTRQQFRVRIFKAKRMQGLKMRSVVGLLQNVQRQATARQICQANVDNTTKLYFNQWRHLLLFFQGKSCSKPKSNQLKALLHQKQKVWNIFTSILQTKRLRTLRLQTADQFIAVQRKHNLLKMLRNLKVRREELSQKQSVLNGQHQRGMVQKYFRAIIRACLIQQRQRTYRMYVLLSKGLKGLQNRVEFRRLKQNLELIGLHQYNSNLQARSLKQFKHAITRKNQLIVLQLRGQQQSQSSLVARVWKLLQVNAATHQKYKYFDKFYALKLQEKAFLKFRLAVIKSIKLRKATKIVKTQHCQLLMRAMLDKLLRQGSSKIRAKHLQNKLTRKVQLKLTSKFYAIWLSKFKFYRAKFETVNMKHLRLVKVNAFDKWFELAKESMINARIITKFELKKNQVKKERIIVALKRYAEHRVQRKQMTMVSRFYFIKKVLTKTLYALRTNIKADILFNNREQSKQSQLIHKCFRALHKNSYLNKHLNFLTDRRKHLKKEQLFKHWNYIAFKNRRNQNIIQYFMTRRNQTLKQHVFRSILVDSVQQQYCLETFHLRKLFQSWARITYRQRELRRKGMQIKFVNQQLSKHVMLQQWRQNLFMELAMNKLAVPYHATRQLKQVFGCLAQQTHKQRKAKVFHRNLIQKHALKSLYKYAKLKLRSAFVARKVQTRELSQVFGAIAEFAKVRKLESLKCGLIQARVEQRITGKYLEHWRVIAVENLKLVPIERKIESKVRQKWLQKLCFASLKRYVQIRQGKKKMYQSVQNYYYELLVERTFKQLLNYTDFRSLKQTHKCRADRYYKTMLLKRWILAKQQKTDGQIQLSKAYLNISLQRKALKYWLQYIRQQNRAFVMKDQASLFNAIRLKIKAIKGFAMIPYIQDYIEEPNQDYIEEPYLQPQQQSNQKVAPQQSGPKLIFNLRQKNSALLLYSLAQKTNHSKKQSFMKHQFKARHPMNKKSKSRKVIKKLRKRIAKNQSVDMTAKVFQLLNFKSMHSPSNFDKTFQSSFSPLLKIKGTSAIKNAFRDDSSESSKYNLNLFKREQEEEEEVNSSSSSELRAFQEPHPKYQHETRLLQQSDCYQNLLLESGLLDSKLENSIIIAEKMLNEKPFKGSNFNDSFTSQNKSGEQGVFVVQRLVDDRKQSQQWLNQFEEPFDAYSEDDEKEYGEDEDEDGNDLDNSELRIENFYEDDYKANAVSQKVKAYFHQKEELSSLRKSVKSNKVLDNIKGNLNYLNLNN